jgi:predicted DNA-binding protein (UPF0251 family)
MMRGRKRRGRYGRRPLPVKIGHSTTITGFRPEPEEHGTPISLEHAELEVLRLLDIENLSQEEAGDRMGVSRGTVWRLQKSARRKMALALTEGRRVEIVAAVPE